MSALRILPPNGLATLSALTALLSPLPPGPKGLFLIGNIFDVPRQSPWLTFREWGRKWGDITSITVFGQTMIILNSVKVAEDLLDLKGANFSVRPVIQMGGEMVGFRDTISLKQDGNPLRQERRLFHQLFGSNKAVERFIAKLLQFLLQNPGQLKTEQPRTTGAIVLRIAFGYEVKEGKDEFIEMFDTRNAIFSRSTHPTAFLVNLLPILRYWPEWLPGGGFRTLAKKWAKDLQVTLDAPLEYVKQEMAAGTAERSFTSTLLEERTGQDELITWAASAVQAGGSSTTATQLESFFLAMTLYPEVQAEAQEEIDRVVGNGRLPDISDRANMPYMTAFCRELLRWHTVVPTGIPHRTREDYIYERDGHPAYLIPKGALVFPNLWFALSLFRHMSHDPDVYPDPMTFNPNRFIETDTKKSEQDPARICFGYGRRVCPGKLLADASLFLVCSMVLSVFNIRKASKDGVDIEPVLGQTTGTVSQPLPFGCTLEARSEHAIALIQGSSGHGAESGLTG
ncbi:cytochrome P450 [Roridomyces roridus]|uniref:Cytochrome P450 n=1 Tax=Roridomyces roridus TaxID=1738132 RepID=A0AAD7CKZ8_9AGAR|nr:cytochrome P450 [Roridomyces roridus]